MSKVYIVVSDYYRVDGLCNDVDDIMVTTSKEKAEILKKLHSDGNRRYTIIPMDTNEYSKEIERYKEDGCRQYWDVSISLCISPSRMAKAVKVHNNSPYCQFKPFEISKYSEFEEIVVYGIQADSEEKAKEIAVKEAEKYFKMKSERWDYFFNNLKERKTK